MEHTNLFFYENEAAMTVDYPNGKVDSPVPGVAYARANNDEGYTVLFNKKLTSYTVTVHHQDGQGTTLAQDTTVTTPDVLEGNSTRVVIPGGTLEYDNKQYETVEEAVKLEISADTAYTLVYVPIVQYEVTIHHMCAGSAITADTTALSEEVREGDFASVTISPVSVDGYISPEAVTMLVSADTDYTLEYEEAPAMEYVDLGLPSGILWGAWNLGANSPEQSGNYYAWGETTPNKATAYTWDNYAFGGPETFTKYNATDGKLYLDETDDAAAVLLGGNWHIPEPSAWEELFDINLTTLALTTMNGVSGVTVTSIQNGNSIFLPFVGAIDSGGTVGAPIFISWTNILDYNAVAYDDYSQAFARMVDNNGGTPDWSGESGPRYSGFPIRPVIGYSPGPM